MSITDELRAVAAKTECANGRCEKLYRGDLERIADRIDAEHERTLGEWDYWESTHVELPKDADGEPIHVGDTVTCGRSVWQVTGLRLTGAAWGICCTIFNNHGGSGTNVYPPCDLRHYHSPTVEDVLREMLDAWGELPSNATNEAIVAEYAAKLRLKEDA